MLRIRKLLILLVFLSFWTISYAVSNEIPITLGSPGWALITETNGKVIVSYPSIQIHLDSLSMKPNSDHYKSPIKVTQFKVGLSRRKGESWENVRYSNYYIVNETLSEGQVKSFDNLDMTIPIDGFNDLKDYWITLQFDIQRDGSSVGYIYAPSKRDIFESIDFLTAAEIGEKIMDIINKISPFISALAALGIFLFTWLNFKMYKKIQAEHSEQEQKFNDLFEGIVIATLLSNANKGVWEDAKKSFGQQYKGKTQIFKEENKDKK